VQPAEHLREVLVQHLGVQVEHLGERVVVLVVLVVVGVPVVVIGHGSTLATLASVT
jgi:hypothetical protein